ncbi:tRNA (adenosine(37)-N6)-threonylcarbamoyltransferase complex ATPase subunit type 1 TsaE [Patescibacteria group bacterium]|nr:tRNA (adenosine(37)-N6)-threonylcarbamoyltransferase complex ATPase subunit type 1 TsaE [Patescibacteria group bacterium]MBU4481495.1 tRNA (adenosine(37)-N6)-threonylcarbamoyltransferase complex ATPase subunit type 1 TsaE [Patescibacteria group bacterium]
MIILTYLTFPKKSTEYLTDNPSQTKKLGERLAKKILMAYPKKTAKVFGLEGNLGSGKTTFLQGFAKGLGIKQKILSPTFIIMRKFEIRNPKSETNSKFQFPKFQTFYHIDCYRIEQLKEVLDLGFREIVKNPQNIVAIEWADRIRKILPKTTLMLKFKFLDKNKRLISF